MSEGNSSTRSCEFLTEPLPCERALPRRRNFRNQFFDPLALGLLGLALAVALWSFGSRLSLYSSSDPSVPHVPKARLWAEQRVGMDSLTHHATARRLKARVYVNSSGVFAPLAADPKFFLRVTQSLRSVMGRPRSIPFFHSAIPLRSPPSIFL